MHIFLKRILIALGVGVLLALAAMYLLSNGSWLDIRTVPFWTIMSQFLVMAFFIALLGVYTVHPIFHFKMFPYRGALIGVLFSIPTALGTLMLTTGTFIILLLVITLYAICGFIIDLIATKYAGQGSQLLDKHNT